jgi:hypothetical protein
MLDTVFMREQAEEIIVIIIYLSGGSRNFERGGGALQKEGAHPPK